MRRLRARLARDPGELATRSIYLEIANAVGVSADDVAVMDSRLSAPDASLNAPMIEGDETGTSSRVTFLVDDKPLPDEVVEDSIDGERRITWLRGALGVLNDRELRIVRAAAAHGGRRHAGSARRAPRHLEGDGSARSRTGHWISFAEP